MQEELARAKQELQEQEKVREELQAREQELVNAKLQAAQANATAEELRFELISARRKIERLAEKCTKLEASFAQAVDQKNG